MVSRSFDEWLNAPLEAEDAEDALLGKMYDRFRAEAALALNDRLQGGWKPAAKDATEPILTDSVGDQYEWWLTDARREDCYESRREFCHMVAEWGVQAWADNGEDVSLSW